MSWLDLMQSVAIVVLGLTTVLQGRTIYLMANAHQLELQRLLLARIAREERQ